MATINALDFTVKIDDFRRVKVVEKTYSGKLLPNQVLLEIDQFSFTSNNITYGVVGKQMNYWKFFPTQSSYGIIPVWGLANVVISNHPDVQVGQRFYGYYPMSSHLLVTVNNVGSKGFVDNTKHRQALPSIYNFYVNTEQDPTFTPETEKLISIFRPLFVTSFLIDAHLAEQNFYKTSQILITSASSKTAQALACLLAFRKKKNALNWNLLGLTSKRNMEFVGQLEWYDQVMSYDSIAQLNSNEKFVVIDFSGNHNTQFQLQRFLNKNLVYNCLVGLVDWQNLEGENPLPEKGEFFFAPTHAEKRREEWGVSGFQQKIGIAWLQFMEVVQSTISIKEHIGVQELEKLYSDMLNGKIDPKYGNIVSLNRMNKRL
ncbi:DUF2855 family protein [Muricauda sp. SCSIO 64092]|uniref:DUF2855 family protein n=1 Tax=Allomuricauda sp. SCSIO 64092 TaxID=2908842 RepID=UPI001FF3C42A|nr:DUF2855 family protein [Muricauda sp. SCSIO 64092]UOY08126.1 DUF2855 family protein [Muricauda sp. SCSIO 64092]